MKEEDIMDDRIKIVIIDSGVSSKNEKIKSDELKGCSFRFGSTVCQSDDIEDRFGHGTGIYGIIKHHNPDAEIFVLKIYDDNLPTIEHLIYALKYVNDNIRFDIVNISMAIVESTNINLLSELRSLCNEICNRKRIIVAAFSNDGLISYPAAFESVIGVSSGEYCHKIEDIEYFGTGDVNVCALGSSQRILTIKDYMIASGNSLACAHVTGIVSKIFRQNDDYEAILVKLKERAKCIYQNSNNYKPLLEPKISGRAIVFPLNKETQCLCRFTELLLFPISGVYDTRYSGYVGSDVGTIIGETRCGYKVKDIAKIDYTSFDTLILGHIDKLCYSEKIERIIADVINNCLISGKYIYSFGNIDRLVKKENAFYLPRIFTPDIKHENIYYAPMGKMHKIFRPVVGVFGTSSRQGKFTLQLMIRKQFMKWGYKIGQISSEPSGYLFGIDICFPFGYGSSTEIYRHDRIAYLNQKEWELCQKGVDIILAGCQSFIIPCDYNNLDRFPLSQLEFLYGILPDVVILCVNAYDDIKIIMRTIQLILSVNDCKILGLVASPIDIVSDENGYYRRNLSDARFYNMKEELKKATDISIFRLDIESDIEKLCLDIVDYFKA